MKYNMAAAQLWGGMHDGLVTRVRVGAFTGPPHKVDIAEGVPTSQIGELTEAGTIQPDVPILRYWLDEGYTGEHLLYRLEQAART